MSYRQRVRVTRPFAEGAGTQDPDTGAMTPTVHPDEVLYEGEADVQDRRRTIRRGQDGQPTLQSDADCFLPMHVDTSIFREEDAVTVTFETSREEEAAVAGVSRLDGILFLRRF